MPKLSKAIQIPLVAVLAGYREDTNFPLGSADNERARVPAEGLLRLGLAAR
jgi:hypothetical protein